MGQSNYLWTAPEYVFLCCFLGAMAVWWRSLWLGGVAFVATTLVLAFFRPWTGDAPTDPSVIMCPCDGKVLDVVQHPSGILQIAVFLNVHNIHVQYAPLDGTVTKQEYHTGTFVPAYMFEKSSYNERMETTLQTTIGSVTVVQIAGQVARRIVSLTSEGAVLTKGQPFGLIKLGSRVDVWLPAGKVMPLCKKGQRVRIGDTIARIAV